MKTDEKSETKVRLNHDEMSFLAALNASESFKRNFRTLYDRLGSMKAIYESTEDQIKGIPELRIRNPESIVSIRSKFKPGLGFDRIQGRDVKLVTFWDDDYPKSLKTISDPPPLLYIRGDIKYDFALSIAIVGTRRSGQYGRRMAYRFAKELSEIGFTVISGGASGVDSEAHKGCLDTKGKTFAIFGSGIDMTFPVDNKDLFKRIASCGALVSEFPPGTQPEPFRFPVRNRIIAGMSRGVLVVEASRRSGALITSDYALEMGREIMAIPGQIDNQHADGVNQLIRDGASLILSIEDILATYKLTIQKREKKLENAKVTDLQRKVIDTIGYEPKHVDDIAIEMKIPVSQILGILLELQIDGFVKELVGKRFVKLTP